jgi:dienelactone hydrolase
MNTLGRSGWTAGAAAVLLAAMATSALGAIHTESIEYKDGDTTLEGYLAYDDTITAKRPGVLIVHEWWGLGEQQKRRARMLAELGYVAFALDMYGKGKLTDDPKQAAEWASAFRNDPETAKRRFEAGLTVLRDDEHVDASRIAAIGYCFGGGICLDMARMGVDLAGVVSFHGTLGSNVPERLRKPITAKILVCTGADDPNAPPAVVNAFEEEMREAGADWELISYGGAVHSVTNPDADRHGIKGVAYNAKADRRSWEAMKQFLAEILGETSSG